MEVDPEDSQFKSQHEGDTVHFCSQECKEKFDKDPEQYSEAA
jgi:YHS domain-containing protein